MNLRRSSLTPCVLALAAFTAGISAGQRPSPQAEAAGILQTAGASGGVVVHLGCGDGQLTAALRGGQGYLVQGLDRNADDVVKARAHVQSLGLYGAVSIDRLVGDSLPYVDNFANLVVVERLSDIPMAEVLRILTPNGVACVKKEGVWMKTVKPWPAEIDQWTHFFHDATGNPVAHDSVVGPPRRYQWLGGPRWARHHDHMASMSALVSASGRVFYIMDEGLRASIQLPAHWSLIARDAFNGTILWKREIPAWNTHKWPLKSGPAQVTRRLAAVGNRVFVTLGLDAPLTILDAATGQTIRTCTGTANTDEIIVSDGVAFLLVSESPSKWPDYRQEFSYVWDNSNHANRDWAWDGQKRRIVAVEAETGKVLWKRETAVVPLALAADSRRVYLHDGEKLVALDRHSGTPLWNSEPVARRQPLPVCFGPRLLVWQDVVVFAGGSGSMTAVAAPTGKTLWSAGHPRSGHQSPEDLFVIDGLVWSGDIAQTASSGVFKGLDVHTGTVEKQFPPDVETYWFHHRCYPSKATDKFLITSRNGTEFISPESQTWQPHHWVRGGCIYGIMPCNGLVYAPPQACGCYLEGKLCGFSALAPASTAADRLRDNGERYRLERGPAYEDLKSEISNVKSDAGDWPTYRHDPARSGRSGASVPTHLKQLWQADLGGRLSSVVVAEGRLFVASIDTHAVHALKDGSGERLWSYVAGGRVDSPPTVWQGRVLFGSADGWVYCLRATDGVLAWRFRAAPADLRMMAYEQIESVWPVHGSVLVRDGVLYCVAGRSMFLDGGLRLLRLDPATGRKLSETILDDRDPDTDKNLQSLIKQLAMPVSLPDVLSTDGRYVYMRSQRFDLNGIRQQIAPLPVDEQAGEAAHLFCQVGFLDDAYFFRSFWMYGQAMGGGYGGWFRAGRFAPSGRIMVFDDKAVYGYARKPEFMANASVLEYELYAADKEVTPAGIQRVTKSEKQINAASKKKSANASDWELRHKFPPESLWSADLRWTQDKPPLLARAMVLADRTLFVAGPPDVSDEVTAFYQPDDPTVQKSLREQEAALEDRSGALLLAVSASDGKKMAEYRLDSAPTWDGMAAASGRLYLSTMDGKVLCLAGRP
ncbi:MAG: PQQ-binding-like beta-propeller repeat protein [Planctomycetes bacterium]|jgi:outer membrane protein assembly factor BamB|nr:PQQ-binding-like beta-propeller repeat protein [Planctomycetota bacterium]